jgi:RNA polymerase sigma-70 factor (ECF subfamily)
MSADGSDVSIAAAISTSQKARDQLSPLAEQVTDLFDQLRNPLLRYLLGFGLPTPDCEEIIQEAFLALYQHLRRGKSRQNLRAWLFRVAHNLALKKRQALHRHNQTLTAWMPEAETFILDPGLNPEDQFSANQTQERLLAVLRALPNQDRECLSLRAEGLTYREIAEILGMSLSAVAISLGRSLARVARAAER